MRFDFGEVEHERSIVQNQHDAQRVNDLLLEENTGLELQGQLFVVFAEHECWYDEIEQLEIKDELHKGLIVGLDSHFEVVDVFFYFWVVSDSYFEGHFFVAQIENVRQVHMMTQG